MKSFSLAQTNQDLINFPIWVSCFLFRFKKKHLLLTACFSRKSFNNWDIKCTIRPAESAPWSGKLIINFSASSCWWLRFSDLFTTTSQRKEFDFVGPSICKQTLPNLLLDLNHLTKLFHRESSYFIWPEQSCCYCLLANRLFHY